MANVLKSYFWMAAGVLIGIIIVSMLRNGEINWMLTGTTIALSVLTFFAIILMRLEIKGNRY